MKLLKRILESKKILLYKYTDNNIDYFFYKIDQEIKPLEHKIYLTAGEKIGKNLNYQKTLKEKFSCLKDFDFTKIKYNEKSLVKYFKEYFEIIFQEQKN